MFRFYHKVGRSFYPWWLTSQMGSLMSSLLIWLKFNIMFGVFLSLIFFIMTVIVWCWTTLMEALAGNHLYYIQSGMKFSFGLFLFSEAMFFFGIFWSFFDSSINPSIEIGGVWSPVGLLPINPYGIPLFNTVVLLCSGLTATLAHHKLLMKQDVLLMMFWTLVLAFLFELAQFLEFKNSVFSMSDGVFGSVFFFGTGFHGAHVIFGHSFLFFNTYRIFKGHFVMLRHISFELSLVYWHFVDVVWIILFICFYWWSY